MSHVYISLVVTANSSLIESTLLRVDVPLELKAAIAYRDELDEWLEARPIPGEIKPDPIIDTAGLLAAQLSHIIDGRDAELFGPYYIDPEGDAAFIEHRPYDFTRLEAV